MAVQYSMLFAMANSDHKYSAQAKDRLAAFDAALKEISEKEAADNSFKVQQALVTELGAVLGYEFDDGNGGTFVFAEEFAAFIADNAENEFGSIKNAMGALSDLADGYSNRETLSRGDLFKDQSVVNAIVAYQLAATHGGVVIAISNGVCTIVPVMS